MVTKIISDINTENRQLEPRCYAKLSVKLSQMSKVKLSKIQC